MKLSSKKFTIQIDALNAETLLNDALNVIDSPTMAAAAASFVKDSILSKTSRGKDVDNQSFAPYSPNTPKRGRVNLRETGAMLDSIWYQSLSPIQAEIGINSDIADYHQNGTPIMPQRKFFGFTDDDYPALITLIYAQPIREGVPATAPLSYNQNPAAPTPLPRPEPTWEPVAGDIVKKTRDDGTIVFTNKPNKYR